MKKTISLLLGAALLSVLLLTGCAGKASTSSFGVESAGDAGIIVTAQNAQAKSSGTTTITVKENEQIVFDLGEITAGKLQLNLKDGEGNEISETVVSAGDSARFDAEPGELSAEVIVLEKADGTATISTAVKEKPLK